MPSSGDRGVCAAVALGWQVAQLFHSPVHRGPAADPARGDHLPGRSEFPGASQSTWLGEQIRSLAQALLRAPPCVVMEALSDVLAALTDPDRSRDVTLDAVFTLHCRLLEALTVADFRLGKAYGLGRAMAETALRPADAATDEQRQQQFRYMLGTGRLTTIKDWLVDLKTLLPDHTAYAVSRSLHDWQEWAGGNRAAGDWAAARFAIRVQGRRFWWVIAIATLLTAGVIYAGFYLHTIPPFVRLVGGIAWLVGAAGIWLRGAGAVLGPGLTHAEGWLWQTELDGAVAVAATWLPPGSKPSPESGGSVGRLSPDPDRTAELRRHDELRRKAEQNVKG